MSSLSAPPSDRVNVADRLAPWAARLPGAVAVATPGGDATARQHRYSTCTFGQLDADATALARGLVEMGAEPSMPIALLVKPGIEFVKLVFGLLRSGATTVLVDPGMGRRHLVDCLAAAAPAGLIAISPGQALRVMLRRRFPQARLNVTVGRRWFWGGATYEHVLRRGRGSSAVLPSTRADDPAAIIFTSGSTGPPKGVLYTHRMFDAQAAEIQREYRLEPGGVDLACFALFGLFNSAMGVTTVFPEMNFSRPASVDPRKLLAAANDWQVTQAFASPAVWDKVGRHGERSGERIASLRHVFSCGAPVTARILRSTLAMVHPEARMHTPYGATESLPVSTIEAREVLAETAAKTDGGAGVCVGRKFDSIEWRVIRISDEPLATLDDAEEMPVGEIGELIVRGPQVSPQYVVDIVRRAGGVSPLGGANAQGAHAPRSPDVNVIAKIRDGDTAWHRLGDVGYLDGLGRFWYCGRKSQRVETRNGPLYTEPVEAVVNVLPGVRRSALVGIGPTGNQSPVIVIEPIDRTSCRRSARLSEFEQQVASLWNTRHGNIPLEAVLFHQSFPVDVRHNAKINREALARWASVRLNAASNGFSPRSVTGG